MRLPLPNGRSSNGASAAPPWGRRRGRTRCPAPARRTYRGGRWRRERRERTSGGASRGLLQAVEAVARQAVRQGRAPACLPRSVEAARDGGRRPTRAHSRSQPRIVAASSVRDIDPAMGDPQSSTGAPPAPDASAAPPPLLEGIVRVKVPGEKILPFLARASLFKTAPKEVVTKVSTLLQGLECADGSEVITAGKVNDGLGILFSGKAQVLLPSSGGELLPVEELLPGDHFGEVGAVLGKPSPYFVIATDASRVLWLPAPILQGMMGSVPAVSEALAKRLSERVVAFAGVERHGSPELMTEIEAQLLEAVEPLLQAPAQPAADMSGVIPFAELRDFDLSPTVLAMVPTKLIRSFRLLPVKLAGNLLTIAMVNPRDYAALAELKRTLHTVQVAPVAIGLEDFNSALVRLKLLDDSGPKKAGGPRINPDSFQFETVAEQDRASDARAVGDDAIRLVNRIIAAGLEREASDIHIEPTPHGFRVRFRVNGVLQDWTEPIPASTSLKGVTARIKVLAGLDITERRLPQDGRIGVTAGKREIDLRVSTLPANRGEKIALRILEAAGKTRGLGPNFLQTGAPAPPPQAPDRPFRGGSLPPAPRAGEKAPPLSPPSPGKKTPPPTQPLIVPGPHRECPPRP